MRKAIYLLFFLVWLCPAACMAQGLHFGLKAGVLGNKADIQGISNRVKTENMTGFQVWTNLGFFPIVCTAWSEIDKHLQ